MELISVQQLCKSFPGVRALHDVRFELQAGEVHALMGENGAGKSTLMKMLAGVYTRDAGEIRYDGQSVDIASPREAQAAGIGIIHQELQPDEPPDRGAEHLHRPRAARRSACSLDDDKLNRQAAESLARMHLELDPRAIVGDLTVARQQMVEIAKALSLRLARADHGRADRRAEQRGDRRAVPIIRELKARGRRHRLHLAQDGRAEADRRPRHRDARRRVRRHRADRGDTAIETIIAMMVGRALERRARRRRRVRPARSCWRCAT